MAELDAIAASLRRQRQDIDEMLDQTLSRNTDAAELVGKLEELRRRSEDTLRRFQETEWAPGELASEAADKPGRAG